MAVDAAQFGDTIQVESGSTLSSSNSNCNVQILNKTGISIVGAAPGIVIDCASQSTRCLSIISSSSILISEIEFKNGIASNLADSSSSTRNWKRRGTTIHDKIAHSRQHKIRNLPARKLTKNRLVASFQIMMYVDDNSGDIRVKTGTIRIRKQQKKSKTTKLRISSDFDLSTSGGCILVSNSTSVSLQKLRISGGTASFGGGLMVSLAKDILISDVIVENSGIVNDASDVLAGGGIYIFDSKGVYIRNASICNNSMSTAPGDIEAWGIGLMIEYCDGLLLQGPIRINGNVGSSVNGVVNGGGFVINACNRISILGPFEAKHNVVSIGDYQDAAGGGGCFTNCKSLLLSGSFDISNNIMQAFNGTLFGGSLEIFTTTEVVLNGTFNFNANQFTVASTGQIEGASLYMGFVTNFYVLGNLSCSNNFMFNPGPGKLYGGGYHLYRCESILIRGHLLIANNEYLSYGNYAYYGAGFYASTVSNHVVMGEAVIVNNSMISNGGNGQGAGLYAYISSGLYFSGPLRLYNNSLKINFVLPTISDETAYTPPPLTNDPKHCKNLTIVESVGTLNDGSLGNYSDRMYCTWLLAPLPYFQAFGVLEIEFSNLDTEPNADVVSIFDGPSTLSPLIGDISGSLNEMVCFGRCAKRIVSTVGAVLITFYSDVAVSADGFELQWKVKMLNRTEGDRGEMLLDPHYYISYAMGGGIALEASQLSISSGIIAGNSVSHPIFASGAGAFLMRSSQLTLINTVISNNKVVAIIAAGGGLSAMQSSTLDVQNCSFVSNAALAFQNQCFYTRQLQKVLCPAAIAGSVLFASTSKGTVTGSIFMKDRLQCGALATCSMQGGSVAVVHSGTSVNISNIRCEGAELIPSHELQWGDAGFVHIIDATVTIHQSVLLNNIVHGIGIGGAIYASGSANLKVSDSVISNNTVREGGAFGISQTATLALSNSNITGNVATTVAGAMVIKDDASVDIVDCIFDNNIASRASAILTYNDDNLATYQLTRVKLVASPGNFMLMLGRAAFSSNEMYCTWPGTVFTVDSTKEFFSLTCSICTIGTYAVESASTSTLNRSCLPCPFGGKCAGATQFSNGLEALTAFWGSFNSSSGSVSFYPCPMIGYCCPLNREVPCSYNYCQGNRIGRLCGRCRAGQGFRFFSEACGDDSTCSDARWAIPVTLIAAFVIVVYLLLTTGKYSDGSLTVLLYFYQVLPFAKSTAWKFRTSANIVNTIESIFGMSPSSGDESAKGGVCLMAGMTASQKLGSRLLLQAIVMGVLISTFVMHFLVSSRLQKKSRFQCKPHHYVATAIRFTTIAYTTLVLVPLQMLQCVYIDGGYYWFWDASISCFESWQIGSIAAIGLLFPLPIIVIMLLILKWKSTVDVNAVEWKRETWNVLTNGYSRERRWWLGVSLYRRLLLAIASTMIKDQNWKTMAVTVLCCGFAMLSSVMKPFQASATQNAEIVSLVILMLLAVSSSPQLSQQQYGTQETLSNEVQLEWIQLALSMIPLLGYVLWTAWSRYLKLKFNSTTTEFEEEEEPEWENAVPAIVECENCSYLGCCENHQYC